jgi:hypothetical protein
MTPRGRLVTVAGLAVTAALLSGGLAMLPLSDWIKLIGASVVLWACALAAMWVAFR